MTKIDNKSLSTQYAENERDISPKNLDALNLNPHAMHLLAKSYIEKAKPLPYKAEIMIGNEVVDFYMMMSGYLGKYRANPNQIDQTALRLFVHSYVKGLYPLPCSFLYMGIEVHLRSRKMREFERKNPLREIYDPTK